MQLKENKRTLSSSGRGRKVSGSRQSPELRVWARAVLGYPGRRGRGAPAGRAAGAQPRPPKPVEEGGQRLRHGQDSAAGRRCSGLARDRAAGQASPLRAPSLQARRRARRWSPAARTEPPRGTAAHSPLSPPPPGPPTSLGFSSGELPAWLPAPPPPVT